EGMRGLTGNAIGPGATVTPINRAWIDDPVKREMVEQHIPRLSGRERRSGDGRGGHLVRVKPRDDAAAASDSGASMAPATSCLCMGVHRPSAVRTGPRIKPSWARQDHRPAVVSLPQKLITKRSEATGPAERLLPPSLAAKDCTPMTIACFCGTVYETDCRVNACPDCGTTAMVPTLADLRLLEQIRSLPETGEAS
ncbi:MAG: hypothetical protein J2P57_20885, partial [Acidimicrobiaceae bacterium]|nr:hypothetical protein [Acidimicrobiaceae bacterium]